MSNFARITGALVIAALCTVSASLQARAAGTVTDCSTFGPGAGTLEAALVGGGTVTFACSGIIGVNRELTFPSNTSIDGAGQTVTLSSATFSVSSADVHLELVSLSLALARILNANGSVAIIDCTLLGMNSTSPFAIENVQGELSVLDSTISGYLERVLLNAVGITTIKRSTITENGGGPSSSSSLGTIFNTKGVVTIIDSTVARNASGAIAAVGIIDNQTNVTMINSTVSGNSFRGLGGGNITIQDATFLMINSTVTGNFAEAAALPGFRGIDGIYNVGGALTVANAVIDDQCLSPTTPSAVNTDAGNNIEIGDTCGLTSVSSHPNTDPMLGPLQDNGGPTHTHALLDSSPAIDAVPLADCLDDLGALLTADQRGVPRPQGAACDSGAYEYEHSFVEALIDVQPGNDISPINPTSRGVIPVAILGSETFDVADVDATTLAFGPSAATLAHRNGPHGKDTNRDGLDDLLGHFRTEEAGITFGDTEACVTGELLDGTPFEGCDDIRTLPACGIGFELALLLPPLMWVHRRRRG